MLSGGSRTVGRNVVVSLLIISIALSFLSLPVEISSAHHDSEAVINSRYDLVPVTIDGVFDLVEWANATLVDMTVIPMNQFDVFLYVKNNETHLFFLYDAIEDTTQDDGDTASLSFDGDHNGAATHGGDDEFTVKGSNDSYCVGFSSPKCHYVYDEGSNDWIVEDPMDESLPYHSGLNASVFFGPSPNQPTDHRIYEFSIPIALLGQPTMSLSLGDRLGFYVGNHASSKVGVRDASTFKIAYWPQFARLAPNEYGDLVLGTPTDVALYPSFSSKPAKAGKSATFEIAITNTGSTQESYDLEAISTHGWPVSFFDGNMNPLSDSGGNSSLVDTGPIATQSSSVFKVSVSVPPAESPGSFDIVEIVAHPWSDPSANDSVFQRTGVPFVTPWYDYLEGGSDSWYVFPRPVNDWEFGTPDPLFPLGPSDPYSGLNAWATNLSGNYSLFSNSVLYSPFIEIPDYVTAAKLSFWHWYNISGDYQDGGWVEMSRDGLPWNVINPIGGYPEKKLGGAGAYAKSSNGWVQAEFNLTSFVGDTVSFRFRLWDYVETGEPASSSIVPGWYLDDFNIQVSGLTASVDVYAESKYKFGVKTDALSYEIHVKNKGLVSDTIDILVNSSLDWTTDLYDSTWQPLSDTEMPPDDIPDTNVLNPGAEVVIYVNITIPLSAGYGDMDTTLLIGRSSVDLTVMDSVILQTQLAYPLPFFDDMDAVVDGWTYDPLWHLVNSSEPCPSWNLSYSNYTSWWYGIDTLGNYNTGVRNSGNLTTPPIDLTEAESAELTFEYWYETEYNMVADQRWLLLKVGNSPWQEPYDPGAVQLTLTGNRTWLGWTRPLDAYVGNIIQIRFLFDTVDGSWNDYQGWYVDDLSVHTREPANDPPSISIEEPKADVSWTGGSKHQIIWTAEDLEEPSSNLTVWLNYSLLGVSPWAVIQGAQGISGDSGPYNWSLPLANSSRVVINATVMDSGRLLGWCEASEFEMDSSPPFVEEWSPKGDKVPTTRSVSVFFSEDMNATSVQSAFKMSRTDTWVEVLGELVFLGNTLIFDPLTNLQPGIQYMANISKAARDDSNPGNEMNSDFNWNFTTNVSGNLPPSIFVTRPLSGESWTGGYVHDISWVLSDDEPIETLRVWLNFSDSGGEPWTPIIEAQGIPGSSYLFSWNVPRLNSSNVVINATVVDSEGLFDWRISDVFKIDSSPPTVAECFPTGEEIPLNTIIEVTFSEEMDWSSVEASLVMVRVGTWSDIPGTFWFSGNTTIFDPAWDLQPASAYLVNISAQAHDRSVPGNPIMEFSWAFLTAKGDTIPPAVIQTHPSEGDTDVAVTIPSIWISFDESMNKALVESSLSISPSILYHLSWDENTLIIILNRNLDYGATYRIEIDATMARDVAGNPLDGDRDGIGGDDYSFTFSTEKEPPALSIWIWLVVPIIILFIIILLVVLRLFVGEPKKEARKGEGDVEKEPEEVDVEKELKEIDEILGIEEED